MRDLGKFSVLGVLVDALDYEAAVERTVLAARERRPYAVAALAVHGVMTGVRDDVFRYRLNHLDLLAPDGQPVRWGLNLLYHVHLEEQVRGTAVTFRILKRAASERLPVYFYGSRQEVLDGLVARLGRRLPELSIAGCEPGRFQTIDSTTKAEIAERIAGSGARIAFVGLGCPRQEVFVSEFRDLVGMPIVAVGAAFDYLAGSLPEPPERLRRAGLEWLWRLALEPRRLWRRYLLLNPAYLALLTVQALGIWHPDTTGTLPRETARLVA
jgi:N-acetylglucosaminyldiphosphoundecaprenol N-acetyl-beta-D-mannosaminyltransferase